MARDFFSNLLGPLAGISGTAAKAGPSQIQYLMRKWNIAAVVILFLFVLLAQARPAQQSRIAGAIDNSRRVVLYGHIDPRARAGTDQGEVEASLPLP